nr:hypothetical protein YSBCXYJI_YSBCXYJI_CDS_0044 [Caudoviricetes sp.]
MNWNGYWEIDYIISLNLFNYETEQAIQILG